MSPFVIHMHANSCCSLSVPEPIQPTHFLQQCILADMLAACRPIDIAARSLNEKIQEELLCFCFGLIHEEFIYNVPAQNPEFR